jgi:hypothetical protein
MKPPGLRSWGFLFSPVDNKYTSIFDRHGGGGEIDAENKSLTPDEILL